MNLKGSGKLVALAAQWLTFLLVLLGQAIPAAAENTWYTKANSYCILEIRNAHPEEKLKEGESENDQLWLLDQRSGKERLLVQPRWARDPRDSISGITRAVFNLERTKVYFETNAWATSHAIHCVDLATGKEHYLCPGNGLQIPNVGPYAGDLVVWQHRYRKGGGSYDHVYAIDEDGVEIKDLGKNYVSFSELPIFVSFRRAFRTGNKVLILQPRIGNLGDVIAIFERPSNGDRKTIMIHFRRWRVQIGSLQGWDFVPGDLITLRSSDYPEMHLRVP